MTRCALLVVAALVAAGCYGSMRINSAPDPPPSFAGYRTYSWISREPARPEGVHDTLDILGDRIRSEVELWLHAKGYQQRAMTPPDFLVGYAIRVQEKNATTVGDLYSYGQAGGTAGIQEAFTRGFEEGTLMLEFVDARTRQPFWRTSAASVLRREEGRDRVAEAVKLMLQKMPAVGERISDH